MQSKMRSREELFTLSVRWAKIADIGTEEVAPQPISRVGGFCGR